MCLHSTLTVCHHVQPFTWQFIVFMIIEFKHQEDQAFLFGWWHVLTMWNGGRGLIHAGSFLKWTNKAWAILFTFKTRRDKGSSLLYCQWHLNLSTSPNSSVFVSSTGCYLWVLMLCFYQKLLKELGQVHTFSAVSHWWWCKDTDSAAWSLFSDAGQPLSGPMCMCLHQS